MTNRPVQSGDLVKLRLTGAIIEVDRVLNIPKSPFHDARGAGRPGWHIEGPVMNPENRRVQSGYATEIPLSRIDHIVTALFTIESSNGVLTVDANNGLVDVAKSIYFDEADDKFRSITVFDIKEFEAYYGYGIIEGDNIDILDLGYWYKDGYEEPAMDWREELKILRNGGEL